MSNNVWSKDVPVELSSYLQNDKVTLFNAESFSFCGTKPTMIDLFCGAGGFSVGCSWAGFETVFGIDHFKPAMETWVYNHPHSIGCLADIRMVNPEDVANMLSEKGVSHIALLTGGVPCQGFTIANRKHNDDDERNYLYLEYMKYVKTFMPDYIILENVSGMRSTAGGRFEEDIKEHFRRLGYTTTVGMINAADYGVPQYRHRLLFVGVRSDLRQQPIELPKPVLTKDQYRTVRDAFSDLPSLRAGESSTQYNTPPNNMYQELLRGKGFISAIHPPEQLNNHSAPNHPHSTIELIENTLPGEPMYSTFTQRIRLSPDSPSPTQLAGGIRPSFQFGHPTDARGLTTRERARIQSFPDSYVFKGGIVQERVQTGNAVPPLMIYYVANIIMHRIKAGLSG